MLPASNVGLPFSTHHLIHVVISCAFGFWLIGRISRKDYTNRIELRFWALAFTIGCYGWVQTWFPSARVDRATGVISELDQEPGLAFGTIDQVSSIEVMTTLTGVLMTFLMAVHFSRRRNTRFAIAVMVTVSGMISALAGLWLQTEGELSAIWRVHHVPSSVFGLFWYHGNAAAFLNLTWPMGVWLFLSLIKSGQSGLMKQMFIALLGAAVLVQMIAVFVNVSKMGHIVLGIECVVLASALLYQNRAQIRFLSPVMFARGAILLLLAASILGACAWFTGANSGWSRWRVFSKVGFDDPARRHAAKMALQIGSDAGWSGTGPGTFEWVSPHYSILDPLLSSGRWRYAHNDYAQIFSEWGSLGGALIFSLFILVAGRVINGLRTGSKGSHDSVLSSDRRSGLMCLSIAVGSVLIHAFVDFPLQIFAIQFQFAAVSGLAVGMSIPSTQRVSKTHLAAGKNPEKIWLPRVC